MFSSFSQTISPNVNIFLHKFTVQTFKIGPFGPTLSTVVLAHPVYTVGFEQSNRNLTAVKSVLCIYSNSSVPVENVFGPH